MDPRLVSHHAVLALNTRLFLNCLHGLSDSEARRRPSGATNNVGFIAAHLVEARFFLGRLLGLAVESPFTELLGEARGIDDLTALPPLVELRRAWIAMGEDLSHRFVGLTAADLKEPSPQGFPVSDESVLGAIAFLLHHESYHVGQLALLRKFLGYPPMSYD